MSQKKEKVDTNVIKETVLSLNISSKNLNDAYSAIKKYRNNLLYSWKGKASTNYDKEGMVLGDHMKKRMENFDEYISYLKNISADFDNTENQAKNNANSFNNSTNSAANLFN